MKRMFYLTTALATLAMTVATTSCSSDEDEILPEKEEATQQTDDCCAMATVLDARMPMRCMMMPMM